MLGVSILMLRDFPDLELSRLLASGDGLASCCAEFPMVPWVIANLRGNRFRLRHGASEAVAKTPSWMGEKDGEADARAVNSLNERTTKI